MAQTVKISEIERLTHDVLKIITEKPAAFTFTPGQAADISINKKDWQKEMRPFTFTSLPEDDFIEFTIKAYPLHNGVTKQIHLLAVGDELIIHEIFGDIVYKGEGIFIAGGAGITPFIAILKQLEKKGQIGNNKLLFANKTKDDIILEDKFHNLLGQHFINILSDEHVSGYEHGYITAQIIKQQLTKNPQYFYICGPEPMMQSVEQHLSSLGISKDLIVREAF